MLSWLASLLVLFLHGNQAQVATTTQHHSTTSGPKNVQQANDGTGLSAEALSSDGDSRP